MSKSSNEYFQSAKNWYDDVYLETIASRNRYRWWLLWSASIIFLLLLVYVFLFPLQRTQLVMIHHFDNGTVWLELVREKNISINRSQIESDMVRYVVNRESYAPTSYRHQYELVNLLSSGAVANLYRKSQSSASSQSFINRFNRRFLRSIKVENILFINNNAHHHLAQVNFTAIDHDRLTNHEEKHDLLALIAWQYKGIPKNSRLRWLNWDGFTVTEYSVQQRNIN